MVDILVVRYNNPKVEDECIRLVKKWTRDYNLIDYDNYEKNEGLSTVWNRFIRESKADYICLLNSDAFVTKDWLEEMKKPFRIIPNVGVVGPTSDMPYCLQGRIDLEESLKRKDQFEEIAYVSGFCMLTKPSLGIEFPEEIPFYYNEVAWQWLLRKAGYKRVWAKGAFVHHLDKSTSNEGNELLRYNGQIQYENWLRSNL